MHAFRRFIEDQMALRNWQQSDLASASKMSAQLVSKLLKDEREVLPRMPEQSTLRALARAFPPATIRDVRAAAVRAMGVDDVPPVQIDLAGFDDDALLAELGRRIKRSAKAMNPPTGEVGASTASSTDADALAKRRAQREEFERDQAVRLAAGHPEYQGLPGSETPAIDEQTAADHGRKRDDAESGASGDQT